MKVAGIAKISVAVTLAILLLAAQDRAVAGALRGVCGLLAAQTRIARRSAVP